eukprot:gnl/TRDRNA2_/TRDRNA2_48940_c0_seq1.p1 gnl/TRDRNA2_/TRDRNA2_48940_c0~~gnl/TRDRNA2_/TRDRNA2_48940_c0_seq1.p1  ORF type:complete len:463 (-),score=67.24 gnl/TRDRNA2_/TRDRNA2_48940_c0_seq1:93-1481(-)
MAAAAAGRQDYALRSLRKAVQLHSLKRAGAANAAGLSQSQPLSNSQPQPPCSQGERLCSQTLKDPWRAKLGCAADACASQSTQTPSHLGPSSNALLASQSSQDAWQCLSQPIFAGQPTTSSQQLSASQTMPASQHHFASSQLPSSQPQQQQPTFTSSQTVPASQPATLPAVLPPPQGLSQPVLQPLDTAQPARAADVASAAAALAAALAGVAPAAETVAAAPPKARHGCESTAGDKKRSRSRSRSRHYRLPRKVGRYIPPRPRERTPTPSPSASASLSLSPSLQPARRHSNNAARYDSVPSAQQEIEQLGQSASSSSSKALEELSCGLRRVNKEHKARLQKTSQDADETLSLITEYRKVCKENDAALAGISWAIEGALAAVASLPFGRTRQASLAAAPANRNDQVMPPAAGRPLSMVHPPQRFPAAAMAAGVNDTRRRRLLGTPPPLALVPIPATKRRSLVP